MQIFYSNHHSQHNPAGILLNGAPFLSEDVPERAEILLRAARSLPHSQTQEPRDFGMEPILAVHDAGFVTFLKTIFAATQEYTGSPAPVFPGTFAPRGLRRKSSHPESLPGYYCFGAYSPILAGTWEAAYWSAQCALAGAAALMAGETVAYALCRPPGHHAAKALYGGYCYLNNAAIATRYLQSVRPKAPVAILDIDYHHGNGTQEIFYADSSVLFCSLHADPDQDYPYFWGSDTERGEASGQGFNYNWPLPKGTPDEAYLRCLENALDVIRRHQPEFLVVSLGFDTGENDPAGGFAISSAGFERMGALITGLGVPILLVQEGGYHLEKLGEWAAAFLQPFGR